MEIREESRIIRGKIDLGGTLARGLLSTGRVACSHQILSHNVPMNQILKATFNRLRKETGLNVGIRSEVSGLYHRLDSITPVALSKGLFSSIRLSQGQIHYDLPLLICRLLHDYVLFVEDKADSMSPITAIALYDEFRELTPPGKKGAEMVRRLADRLVDVDLLDRAAELLLRPCRRRCRR